MNKVMKMFMAAAILLLPALANVKWLTKDRIAVEEHIDYRIDWKILERVNDGQSMMSRIAGYICNH